MTKGNIDADTAKAKKGRKNASGVLPWEGDLVRAKMRQRRYSFARLAELLTERAGAEHHFSKTYILKVLKGDRRPSLAFVEAMAGELDLPLSEARETIGVTEYLFSRLDSLEEGIQEVRRMFAAYVEERG